VGAASRRDLKAFGRTYPDWMPVLQSANAFWLVEANQGWVGIGIENVRRRTGRADDFAIILEITMRIVY
jgi:hypothetical protein